MLQRDNNLEGYLTTHHRQLINTTDSSCVVFTCISERTIITSIRTINHSINVRITQTGREEVEKLGGDKRVCVK